MIALIVLAPGQLWAGGGRATGRAIGGPMSALCPALSLPAAGPPVLLSLLVISITLITRAPFILASCRPTPIPIISHPL